LIAIYSLNIYANIRIWSQYIKDTQYIFADPFAQERKSSLRCAYMMTIGSDNSTRSSLLSSPRLESVFPRSIRETHIYIYIHIYIHLYIYIFFVIGATSNSLVFLNNLLIIFIFYISKRFLFFNIIGNFHLFVVVLYTYVFIT